MDDIATLSSDGDGQLVHLPEGFKLQGKQVRVRRVATGLMLEPVQRDEGKMREIFAELARYRAEPFMLDGRQQPPMPAGDDVDFDR